MLKNRGGMQVPGGFYWDEAEWEFVQVPRGGGPLPGGPERGFVRVPAAALLVIGPALGGLYFVLLPAIVVGMCAVAIGKLAIAGVRHAFPAKSADAKVKSRH